MVQPSRRRSNYIDTIRPVLRPLMLAGSFVLATACSTFFKLSPEEQAAGAAPKPASTPKTEKPAPAPKVEKPKPAPKVEEPKAEKPKVEKPKEEPKKVEPPKVEVPKVDKPVKEPPAPKPDKNAKPAAVVPPPPETRRSEPVVESMAIEPPPAGSDSAAIDRLLRAAVLWDAVRLFHPAVAENPSQWDNETVRRLTDIRSANGNQFDKVWHDWLSRLNDPATHLDYGIIGDSNPIGPGGVPPVTTQSQIVVTGTKKTRVVDTTVVLTWPRSQQSFDLAVWNSLYSAIQTVGSATQVVIDLRTENKAYDVDPFRMSGALYDKQLQVANALSALTVAGPSVRRRVYEGWLDAREGASSPPSTATWRLSEPLVVVRGESRVPPRRLVLVANENTQMLPAMLALVSSKQATLVSDAPLSDRLLVPTRRIPIDKRFSASVRVGELLNADGSVGIVPDTIVAPAASLDSAPAIRTAIQIARGKFSPRAPVGVREARLSSDTIASNAWTNAHYPIMGARLLSAFKMWGTLRTFHAYNDLRDESIDDALVRFIPRVEAATDAYSFSAAMLDFATAMNDAQAEMTSPTITQHLGAAAAPFATRWIENRAIVTQITADEAGRATGLAIGDEISAADGYPIAAYMSEHRKYGAASNDWTSNRNSTALIPRGVPGDATFKVRDANNRERSVTITRSAAYLNRVSETDRGATSVFRSFAGGLGYLDLDRATTQQVDSAFEVFGTTRALILDARGRGAVAANGTMNSAMQSVLERIAAIPTAVIDKQTVRVASEPCAPADPRLRTTTCASERRQFDDIITADTTRRYRGRIVVLIDERTQGAMEQFGLGAESVNNPVFIGGPSAGAAGLVTSVQLPGLINLTFSGSELRHADGRQLQRVGLTPQVEVAPTVKGVRAGTDEVLTRAQEWLLQQLDPAAPKRKK